MARKKYQEWLTREGLIKIEGWARDGLTEEQIARNMGISRVTLIEWKKRYPDILNTLKRGKDVADREVENALFKSACGWEYDEVTETEDSEGRTSRRVIHKQVLPNPAAIIFWLKNRKPNEWRDRREVVEDPAAKEESPMLQLVKSLEASRKGGRST